MGTIWVSGGKALPSRPLRRVAAHATTSPSSTQHDNTGPPSLRALRGTKSLDQRRKVLALAHKANGVFGAVFVPRGAARGAEIEFG